MVRVLWESTLPNFISNPDADKNSLSKFVDDTEPGGLYYKESQSFYSKEH